MLRILSSKCNRSLVFITHSVTKCSSSSTTLHSSHNRRWDGTFGLVYLPRSISKVWELARSFDIAGRYLTSLTLYRYDYVPKSNLKRQYLLNNGLWSTFNSLYHLLIKSLITFERQCLWNSFTLPPIVTPKESTISSILDTQVLKPWWCKSSSSVYTDLANVPADNVISLCAKESAFIWQNTDGGRWPHSP